MHGPDTSLVGLVLDDEFLIAIEIESILAAAGYQVVSAVSVREARRLIDGDTGVDFAVLDFRMGEGAVALARDLMDRNIPIFFCTGSLADEVHSVFPGAPVVAKPFVAETLLGAITKVVGYPANAARG